MNIPLEDYEIEMFANWLRMKGYLFNNIMNETDGRSLYKGAKRKRLGVNSGCPDFLIVLKRGSLIFIEMKRSRGISEKTGKVIKSPSNVSEEQKFWVKELNKINNVQAEICYGHKEAIKLVLELENF